jgi:ATP adenylyltransferase
MIAPYRHVAVYEKSAKAASDELADLLKLSLRILRKSHRPHGFNTGMNLGASAGAGVADHYHFHVIPRWVGDSNFMPLISQTRVVIEDLETTYARLLPFFRDEEQKQQRNKK